MTKTLLPRTLLDQFYMGCPRCGRSSCLADCSQLADFSSVMCFYHYTPPWPSVLALAKQDNDPVWQDQLGLIFYPQIHHLYAQFKRNTSTCLFIGMPLRRERVLNAAWHPVFLWQKAWHSKEQESQTFFILGHLQSSRLQQSRLSVTQRRQAHGENSLRLYKPNFDNELCRIQKKWQGPFIPSDIVLLDDVLTTGKTATQVRTSLLNLYPVWKTAQWHLGTLFRTPQKDEQSHPF